MTWRTKLSNKVLRGLPPSDKRYDILDTLAPGLLASVNPGGSITLMLRTRVGAKSPIRRAIGRYPHVSVEEARQIATEWVRLLEKGGDPKEAQRRAREQERKEREVAAALERNTFALIAEKFITRKCKSQRRGRAVERIIRNELVPLWGDRPLADITHRDVREAIERVIERGAATYAHNVLDAARALFSFAVERDLIEHNPCDRIKRRNVIGHKKSRKRHLNDDELRALWRATGRLGYPFGPL